MADLFKEHVVDLGYVTGPLAFQHLTVFSALHLKATYSVFYLVNGLKLTRIKYAVNIDAMRTRHLFKKHLMELY